MSVRLLGRKFAIWQIRLSKNSDKIMRIQLSDTYLFKMFTGKHLDLLTVSQFNRKHSSATNQQHIVVFHNHFPNFHNNKIYILLRFPPMCIVVVPQTLDKKGRTFREIPIKCKFHPLSFVYYFISIQFKYSVNEGNNECNLDFSLEKQNPCCFFYFFFAIKKCYFSRICFDCRV